METVDLHEIEYVTIDLALYQGKQYYIQKFKNISCIKKTLELLYDSEVIYSYAFGWHYLLFPYIEGVAVSDLYKQTNFIEGIRLSIQLLFQLLSFENYYEKLYMLSDKDYITYDFSFHLLQGISIYRIKNQVTQLQAMSACLELIAPFIETHIDKEKQKWKSMTHFMDKLELMQYEHISEIIDDLKCIEKEYIEKANHKKKKMNLKTKLKIILLVILTIIVIVMITIHIIYHNYETIQELFPLTRIQP